MFTVLVRESMLPVEKAFRIVSEGGDELAGMISEFKAKVLQDLGLTEDEVIMTQDVPLNARGPPPGWRIPTRPRRPLGSTPGGRS